MRPSLPLDDLEHVLTHTESLWGDLRGERVFVTGGTGFFGRWLVGTFAHANRRLSLGATATVLTRAPQRFAEEVPDLAFDPAVTLQQGDVRSLTPGDARFACVIHAATESSRIADPADHRAMFETIVEGTRRTLDFAARVGARRALLVSSGAVYGPQPADMSHLPETHLGAPDCTDPRSAYAEGKRAAELLASIHAAAGLPVSIARCFAFVGPHLPLDAHFAVGNFVRDALAGGPIHVAGDGTPLRSYLYAADLAIWLWTVALRGTCGRVYNVGSEHALSIGDLAATVAAVVGAGCAVDVARAPADGPPHRYVPATERARRELGLVERIPLGDALARTIRPHRELARPAGA